MEERMKTGRDKAAPTAGRSAGLALASVDPDAPEEMRKLALRLRQLLDSAGFTGVREIASACDLGRTTVSDALSGTRAPTWPTVATLLRLCRVAPDSAWKLDQEAAKSAEQDRKSNRRTVRSSGGTMRAGTTTDSGTTHHGHGAVLPGTFSVRAPYGELPPRVRGRDTLLAALERELIRRSGPVQVLHGLGGSGKTTVALQLARFAHDRNYRVYWVSASTRDSLATGMRQVARELRVSEQEVEVAWSGRASATDLVWRALDDADQPWLLVVDNADEPSVAAADGGTVGDSTGWIRSSPAGLTLVTTRTGSSLVWGSEAECRSVDVLAPDDGAAVLVDFAGDAGSLADARALSQRLGGLPLALRLAGSYLARTRRGFGLLSRPDGEGGPVQDFVGYGLELERLGAELLDRGEPDGGSAGERRLRRLVSRTWEMSLDLLAGQGLPEARVLMRLLSCFGHAPFPVEVLGRAVENRPELFPEGAERCEAALEALVDLSLLTVEDVTVMVDHAASVHGVVPCLTAHPLVLQTNAQQMRTAPEGMRADLWRNASLIAEQLSQVSDAPDMWKVWQLLVPHITAGITAVPRQYEETLVTFLGVGLAAQHYTASSNNHDLHKELVALLVESSRTLPRGHLLRVAIRRAHNQTLKGSEQVRAACELFEELHEQLGLDHLETILARLGWARALLACGDPSEAERELRAAVDAMLRMPHVPGHLVVAQADLVKTLAAQGKPEETADEARILLTTLSAGEAGFNVALAHHAAHALDSAALLPEAEELYRRILAALEEAAEKRSPLYRDMVRHLAKNLVRQGRSREGMDLLGEFLAQHRADPHSVGAHVTALVSLYHARVDLQIELGEADRAEAELRALLYGDLDGLDSAAPAVVQTRHALVRVLLTLDRPDAAEHELDVLDAALASRANTGAPLWTSRLWRARCHCARGRCADAVTVYDEVIGDVSDDPALVRAVTEESAECRLVARGGAGA
ncbi:hypothetical protein AQJ46_36650 [Streptomyces canus]|uniref:HTH cro/C1-type domain-containing protein n=1 Tax=Streptomyces canus TaxID=58343 RepID=A0A101RTD0_9ACTN|nr:hypothetical protein AQJ46_36650 [Streptomyces canus]